MRASARERLAAQEASEARAREGLVKNAAGYLEKFYQARAQSKPAPLRALPHAEHLHAWNASALSRRGSTQARAQPKPAPLRALPHAEHLHAWNATALTRRGSTHARAQSKPAPLRALPHAESLHAWNATALTGRELYPAHARTAGPLATVACETLHALNNLSPCFGGRDLLPTTQQQEWWLQDPCF